MSAGKAKEKKSENCKTERLLLKSFYKENVIEAGCDEAGRGCLAGPVYGAAVIFPADYTNPQLNDSKKLSARSRYALREEILKEAISWAVLSIGVETIDRINILQAAIQSMHGALEMLKVKPGHIIVDGNKFHPFRQIPHKCIIGGDGLFLSIAAASVLAKTYRDDYMDALHLQFPEYGWDQNKGYATEFHRTALRKYGRSLHHRNSFHLKSDQLEIAF